MQNWGDLMKGNFIADQYQMLIIDKNGITIVKDKIQTANLNMETVVETVNGNLHKYKASYTVVDNEDNKDFYSLMKEYIGRVITLKSKGLNGKFKVSREGEELVITKQQ